MTTMLFDPFASWLESGRRSVTDSGSVRTFMPPTDLLSGERDVRVVMDVPGLTVEDIQIELTDGKLAVRGERRYPYREHEDSHELNRLERGFGRFERVLRVPRDIEPDGVEASLEDGVLTLSIPLPDSRRPHRIEVRGPRATAIEVGDGRGADEMKEERRVDTGQLAQSTS